MRHLHMYMYMYQVELLCYKFCASDLSPLYMYSRAALICSSVDILYVVSPGIKSHPRNRGELYCFRTTYTCTLLPVMVGELLGSDFSGDVHVTCSSH